MNTTLKHPLTEAQIAEFRANGVLLLRDAFNRDWIEVLKRGLERSMARRGEFVWIYTQEADGRHFHNENRRWHEIDEYRRFIFDPKGGKGHQEGDDEGAWDHVPDIDAERDSFDIAGYAICGLQPGDAVTSELFHRIWPRAAAAA